jgi:succinate-semialdehyde dehydrogenase/glutarate-semialdehyde dehydrogenase|tara:strand:- start:2284 stop:2502 length:219 start_codon:yes stop_codon:yes gene_type:complete
LKRRIIADEVYDEFKKLYIDNEEKLRAGDPLNSETTLAPLSSIAAADEVRDRIETLSYGATATEVGPKVSTT